MPVHHKATPPTFHQASLIICQDTFKSHKWPKENFSLRYQYNIKQTSNESKENIQFQILQTNIIWIVWQTVKRITSEILGVKELIPVGGEKHHKSLVSCPWTQHIDPARSGTQTSKPGV